MESGDEHTGLGFSPAEHTILHPKCPTRAVPHSTGHRGDIFPSSNSCYLPEHPRQVEIARLRTADCRDKVLSIPALKTLFSKIQITKHFFCVVFLLSLLTSFFKWET